MRTESNHSGHHHSSIRPVKGDKNILFAFILNFGFAIIEFIGGHYTNSMAITSDALHDLGDSLSLLFSYFMEKLSLKKADEKFTFGYRRFSVLAASLNGFILLAGSVYVIIEAIQRIQNPAPIKVPGMIALALLGVAMNSLAAYRLSKTEGLNSKMIMLHLLEDVLGWIAVLIVSLILLFKPWYILDSILSIFIAFIILKGVYSNIIAISSILLQKFPEKIEKKLLIDKITSFEMVEDVHFVQGWSIDESRFNLTLHIRVSGEARICDLDLLREKIEDYLREKNVFYSTIQFEGKNCSRPLSYSE